MKYQIIEKFAAEAVSLSLVRGWRDSQGNVCAVFDVGGKKYGMLNLKSDNSWYYWMGIGSNRITPQMPAGRGDYIVGQKLEPALSSKLSEVISSSTNLQLISTSGASWYPINQSQLESLARLVDSCAAINEYLSINSLLYTGTDKIIFGDDITGSMVLKSKIVPPAGVASTTESQPSCSTSSCTIPSPTEATQPTAASAAGQSSANANKQSEQNDGNKSRSPGSARKVWTKDDLNRYSGHKINFNLMHDGKNNYRGGLKPKYTELSKEYFESLKQFGIKRIITLNTLKEWEGADLPRLITSAGLEHVYNPVGSVPTREEFDRIKQYLKMGNNLIHCTHGADRTGAVVGRYYVEELGWTPERAVSDSIKYGGSKAVAKPEKYAGTDYEEYSDFITKGAFSNRKSNRMKIYKPE